MGFAKGKAMTRLTPERRVSCWRFNVPHWFCREDFKRWLNSEHHPATWHRGGEPGDYSDIFMTYDHGEGSDALAADGCCIPEDCWNEICEVMKREGATFGLIWLTNLER